MRTSSRWRSTRAAPTRCCTSRAAGARSCRSTSRATWRRRRARARPSGGTLGACSPCSRSSRRGSSTASAACATRHSRARRRRRRWRRRCASATWSSSCAARRRASSATSGRASRTTSASCGRSAASAPPATRRTSTAGRSTRAWSTYEAQGERHARRAALDALLCRSERVTVERVDPSGAPAHVTAHVSQASTILDSQKIRTESAGLSPAHVTRDTSERARRAHEMIVAVVSSALAFSGGARPTTQPSLPARSAVALPLLPRHAPAQLYLADDPMGYAFMLPTAIAVATSCQLCGIGGAALFSPIFLLVFPLLGP
eukprot:scaffold50176_cov78-Phaeocystis_antarctica.AAC.1